MTLREVLRAAVARNPVFGAVTGPTCPIGDPLIEQDPVLAHAAELYLVAYDTADTHRLMVADAALDWLDALRLAAAECARWS